MDNKRMVINNYQEAVDYVVNFFTNGIHNYLESVGLKDEEFSKQLKEEIINQPQRYYKFSEISIEQTKHFQYPLIADTKNVENVLTKMGKNVALNEYSFYADLDNRMMKINLSPLLIIKENWSNVIAELGEEFTIPKLENDNIDVR